LHEANFESGSQGFGAIVIGEGAGLDYETSGGWYRSDGWRRGGRGELRGKRGGDHPQTDARGAGAEHVDVARGGLRKVENPALREGAAIVDADVDLFSIRQIRDFDPRLEGQRAVSGGELLHIVGLS